MFLSPPCIDGCGYATAMLTTDQQAIYLTLFYTKREYALRIGYLFVSAAIAGSLGGIFAYG
jgi:hypothetical protein